ncbi:hypothetical protein EfmAA96_11530 [Enterococcus faecium]|nr:hypothetical protein EfmAA96_11530 [Enterococcus faecium]
MILAAMIKKVGKGYMLQRYKGLGEMNAEMSMKKIGDPTSRTLIRVRIDDAAQARIFFGFCDIRMIQKQPA